jgi:hypothetical protein
MVSLRTRRWAAFGALVVASLLIGAFTGRSISDLQDAPGPVTEPPAPLPDVVDVRCDETGTHVLTPSVRPQRDGIHFRVENRTDERHEFMAGLIRDGQVTPGEFVSPRTNQLEAGLTDTRWVIPPGASGAACLPYGESVIAQELLGHMARFDIVDRDGLYISPDLGCPGDERTHELSLPGFMVFTSPRALLEVARGQLQGLRAEDVVEQAGYPRQPHPRVRVVRDGRPIAVLGIGGRWSFLGVCVDSGITPRR